MISQVLSEEGLDIRCSRKLETPAYSERLLIADTWKYHKRIITHEHFYLYSEFSRWDFIHLQSKSPTSSGHIRHLPFIDEVWTRSIGDYLFLLRYGIAIASQTGHVRLQKAKSCALVAVSERRHGLRHYSDNILDYDYDWWCCCGDLRNNKFNACNHRDYLK